MEDIERVIFDYLDKKSVKSALLINGQWGSGKTHYVKKTIIPSIDSDYANSKVIYQSLYGIKSKEELKLNLYIEAVPDFKFINRFKKRGLKFMTSSILHLWNINLASWIGSFSASTILKEDKNYIFIFDDLERVDGDLGIKSVLGWINNFVEHLGFKTILIGDESRVPDGEVYFKIKEKLIGTTVKFETPSDVIEQINKSLLRENKVDELIYSQKELIKRLYEHGADQNLRSYEFAIDKLKYALKSLENIFADLTDEVLRKLIIYTVAVCFEYRKGTIKEENVDELKQEEDFSQLIGLNEMLRRDEDEEEVEERIPIYEIVNAYFSKFGYSITIFEEINALIVKGRFDVETFIGQVQGQLGRGLTENKNIYNKLYNFRRIEDEEELNRITSRAIELCQNGEFSLGETLFISDVLFYLTYNGVIDEDLEALYDRFETILDENRDNFNPVQDLGHNIANLERDYGDQFERLFNIAQGINNRNIQQKEYEEHQQLFNLFVDDTETFLDAIWSKESSYRFKPIFIDWDPTNTAGAIFGITSNQIQSFTTFISSRYKERPRLLDQERVFLEQLVEGLNERKNEIADDFDKLKLFSIDELICEIEDILS